MKVFAISDLHLSVANPKPMDIFGGSWGNYLAEMEANWRAKVGEDDVVLLAGDFSWAMNFSDALLDLQYLAVLPGKKVLVRGNHDYWWKSVSAMRAALPKGFYIVQNDALRFPEGLVVFGSRGWTAADGAVTEEDDKIYKRETERMKLSIAAAQKIAQEGDRMIAVMHYPPFNVRREPSPIGDLLQASGAQSVVYGHLHGKGCRTDLFFMRDGVRYYLTSCDQINNDPQFIMEI
ncbi:MAG: metallophosphoesterase [Clostridiales bacterium]|jgi:predicted phosphohydrolase|nr:metallophosphoesterase [Clostridiales bacterium]